jgi:hypothetical protein
MRSQSRRSNTSTTTWGAVAGGWPSPRRLAFVVGASWLAIAALATLAGCSRNSQRVSVSGQVLIDGEPLRYGQVVFVPKGTRPSTADLDENGRFTLTSFDPNDGAALGVHQIAVFANEQLDQTRTKWHAPQKYSFYKTSGLTQEITGPTDSLVIELTWKGDEQGKPHIEVSAAPLEAAKK